MKRTYLPILVLFLVACFFASCIEDFRLTKADDSDFIPNMIIEGHILSGDQSVIYVTQTVPTGTFEKPEAVLNATVTIVGENGYESEKAEFEIEFDRYVIPTYDLPANTQYAIRVETDGEIYQSEFQTIQSSNEIDEVYYEETGNGVNIHISSHGQQSDTPYYMWTYEEDWEIHPEVDITNIKHGHWEYSKYVYPELEEIMEKGGENPYYNCWGKNYSDLIHIYSTGNLSQNSVKEHKLFTIPLDDNRISFLYSVQIKQIGLTESSYRYYHTLRRYFEGSGGLFTPMPTEVKGNVKCITRPEAKVIGLVIASQVTTRRIFIDPEDLVQKDTPSFCKIEEGISPSPDYAAYTKLCSRWRDKKGEGYLIWNTQYLEIDEHSLLYSRQCIDCRSIPYATKKRPDFWPDKQK